MKKKPKVTGQSAPNWQALADALGVSRQSVYEWRQKAGAPTTPDIDAWHKFAKSNAMAANKSETLEGARLALLHEQIERARRINQHEASELMPVAEAVSSARRAVDVWHSACLQLFEGEAPSRLIGKDIAEMRVEISAIFAESCNLYRAEVDKMVEQITKPLNHAA